MPSFAFFFKTWFKNDSRMIQEWHQLLDLIQECLHSWIRSNSWCHSWIILKTGSRFRFSSWFSFPLRVGWVVELINLMIVLDGIVIVCPKPRCIGQKGLNKHLRQMRPAAAGSARGSVCRIWPRPEDSWTTRANSCWIARAGFTLANGKLDHTGQRTAGLHNFACWFLVTTSLANYQDHILKKQDMTAWYR